MVLNVVGSSPTGHPPTAADSCLGICGFFIPYYLFIFDFIYETIMKEILAFLRDLEQNNHREWFNANKERYLKVRKRWDMCCEALIDEIGAYDADIAKLSLSDCTYRIYRDTRFSKDKTPYKTHFGVFLAKGGKKSMHAGYYFHLGTGRASDYPYAYMLAAGNYCYDSRAVNILREDISEGWEEFSQQILGGVDDGFVADMDGALKRVPKGYSSDAPYADWMRMRSYCLVATLSDQDILRSDLAKRIAVRMKSTKPFIDYINRAVDYVNEEDSNL